MARSLVGAKLAWPPSVASTLKVPALAMTPPTPRPVPTPTMAQTPWVMGSDRRCEPMGLRSAARKRADCVADGFEVVDDVQVLELLGLAQRPRRKRPRAVGELHLVMVDATGDRDRRPVQRRGHTGRVAAIMLRCMGDGFVGANGVAPHAMNVECSGARAARTAHRDAEADVGSADVCYQSQHRGAVELFSIRIRAGKRCY